MLDSADHKHAHLDQVLDRWSQQDSQLQLTLAFRTWRVGLSEAKLEQQIAGLTAQLTATSEALTQAKDLIFTMNGQIDQQDAALKIQRAKLVSAAKEKVGRLMGLWRPQSRVLTAWTAGALVAKAERQKEVAMTSAGEAMKLFDTTEKQKREITRLKRDLEQSEAEAAEGRLYLKELGKSNHLVQRLNVQIAELQEGKRVDRLQFEEEKTQLKKEVQKIHQAIITDTHASVLHEAIEKLKLELEFEKSRQSRKLNSFMSTASSTMCGSCGRATLYRSFVDKSWHDRSQDTAHSTQGFLPPLAPHH